MSSPDFPGLAWPRPRCGWVWFGRLGNAEIDKCLYVWMNE